MSQRIIDRSWKASELFQSEVEVLAANLTLPFLNVRFNKRSTCEDTNAFVGSGLYAIVYRNKLIYIGSFCPKTNLAGGDIRGIRWARHLETISFRGCHVSIGKGPLRALLSRSELATHAVASHMRLPPDRLHQDRGHVTGINRAAFAIANWDVFGCTDGNVLAPNGF